MKTSEHIKSFLDFVRESETHYNLAMEELEKENKRTQDLLHAIEFEPHSKERSKIATRMRASRIARRESKDIVEELEPLMDFLSVPTNKRAVDLLSQVLGSTRKVEKYHENRSYHPRVEK